MVMTDLIRILILEDLLSDAMLAERELRRTLHEFVLKVVDTESSFIDELRA